MKLFLILLMFAFSVYADEIISASLEPLTDEIVTEINKLEPTWKAGKNFHGNAIPISKLVATRSERSFPTFPKKSYADTTLPESFDARKAWPNCRSIGKIYDQKKGFPSWIYATVGTIADHLCIKAGIQIDVEATVERIMKSSGGFNSETSVSANIGQAIDYWSKKGIFTVNAVKDEICLPILTRCQPDVIKLNEYFKVSAVEPKHTKDSMIDLMLNGPIAAYMQVYSDFPSYQSGVYMRTSIKPLGITNIKIIGWGTENGIQYWLATNSWGTDWGEKGYFKIQRGTGQFGNTLDGVSLSLFPTNNASEIRKDPVDGQLFQLA